MQRDDPNSLMGLIPPPDRPKIGTGNEDVPETTDFLVSVKPLRRVYSVFSGLHPLLLLASTAIITGIALATTFLGLQYLFESDGFNPLYGPAYSNKPEAIAEKSVPIGGTITVTATKCYRFDVGLYGMSNYRRISPLPQIVVAATPLSSGGIKTKGCITQTFPHVLPPDVTAGVWILTGKDTAVAGPDSVDSVWTTDQFTVTAPVVVPQ